jgi:hypothetical protein
MTRTWMALILCLSVSASAFAGRSLQIGTSYSPKQSEYLGLDWSETYTSILDLGFDVIRLGTYWSEIEKKEGTYDFTVTDWQIAEARKRGTPVVLTVGMKAPRWPEYFIPEWLLRRIEPGFGEDISEDNYLKAKTLEFVRAVVTHYKDEDIIRYWQVENEPLDRAGARYWWISKRFLAREIELVKQLDDRKRPVIINVATYPNRFLRSLASLFAPYDAIRTAIPLCDILGLNVYPVVGPQFWWKKFYFWTQREERADYFSGILKRVKRQGKKAWIIEFQAEPWEPGVLAHSEKERPPTGWPEMSRAHLSEFQAMDFETILLWGAEYWVFRKQRHEDPGWWDMVAEIFNQKSEKTGESP